jgi:serine/threonine-protein kinase
MSDLHSGDQLDYYRIDGLVARSGMASIFRGTDTRDGRAVAIKLPHEEMEADPILYDRFQREEDIGKKLDHPGVVRVLTDEKRSRRYMVLEWVEGRLLRQILNEAKKLPAERATRITLALSKALEYIHAQGVVHRDLKPENIMIGPNDEVKLIDFGIAANAGSRRLTFAKLTQAMGTPDYISPEQVKGKRGDARSDVYSLGIMFYEMLTGKVPFTGPNPFVIMNERLLNNPIPPREVNPEITPEMQEIIYRALERDPSKRYPNAHEFALDLEHPEKVGVADREELKNWKQRRSPIMRQVLFYIMLALIPVVVFGLMLFIANRK